MTWSRQWLIAILYLSCANAADGATPTARAELKTDDQGARPALALTRISWDSPRVREIESAWRQQLPEIPDLCKDRPAKRMTLLAGLLRKHLSREELRGLAAACAGLPTNANEMSEDDETRVNALVRAMLDAADRDGLKILLSTRCPTRICFTQVELYLALADRKIKHPILVLGDAFSASQVPETRRVLASALRHAFANARIHAEDDAEFVRKAMRWYDEHKEDLSVNPAYGFNSAVESPDYSSNPLFQFKAALHDDLAPKDRPVPSKQLDTRPDGGARSEK